MNIPIPNNHITFRSNPLIKSLRKSRDMFFVELYSSNPQKKKKGRKSVTRYFKIDELTIKGERKGRKGEAQFLKTPATRSQVDRCLFRSFIRSPHPCNPGARKEGKSKQKREKGKVQHLLRIERTTFPKERVKKSHHHRILLFSFSFPSFPTTSFSSSSTSHPHAPPQHPPIKPKKKRKKKERKTQTHLHLLLRDPTSLSKPNHEGSSNCTTSQTSLLSSSRHNRFQSDPRSSSDITGSNSFRSVNLVSGQ